MPNRVIREGILESEAVDLLTDAAETFFVRLMLKADDYGRYPGNPALLRAHLYPLRLDRVKEADITTRLHLCVKAGLVDCYKVDGTAYLQIRNFRQRMRAPQSKFPEPSGQMLLTDSKIPSFADSQASNDGHMTVISQTEAGPPRSEAESDTEAESIYGAYPRKIARKDALKAIAGALKLKPAAYLLEKTMAYAAAVASWPSGEHQFIPHPATWFNRGSYDDNPEEWKRTHATDKPNPRSYAQTADYSGVKNK